MKTFVLTMAVLALTSAAATAGPLQPGQFAGAVKGGVDLSVSGDVHGGATAPVASLRALNPNLPAVPAELRIQARSFKDIYGEAATYGLEGAYGLSGNREVFGAINRVTADQGSTQVGTAFVPALSASLPVQGRFGDYKATTFEAGLRQFFYPEATIKPFIAGRIGVARVDEIRASFTVPVPTGVGAEPNDIVLSNVAFYDDSTSFTVGGDIGADYDVSDRFSIRAEIGLRYQGKLDGNDSAIGPLGLARINDDGARWSAPITISGRVAF